MSKATEKLLRHFAKNKTPAEAKRALAETFNVHEETIRLWLRDGIPLAKAIDVERNSGGIVTAEEILREAKAAA